MFSCALVIPCYNEEKRLPQRKILDHAAAHPHLHFVFVNDGSKDGTSRVLREMGATLGAQATVLDNAKNQGKAGVVRQGLLHGLDQTEAAVVGFWDADLATPLESVDEMLAILEAEPKLWMIFGARVQLLGRRIERKLYRHYLGRVFATVVSNLLRLPVYDTQCGAKLFRRNAHIRSLFADEFVSRWIFDVEIIARYQALGPELRPDARVGIYEYPLPAWEDVDGSKVGPADFLKALGDLWKIRGRYAL